MPEPRANPDQLLRRLQAEEARAQRAKLKIFFGAAPGVGKTYAMLEAAQAAKTQGRDVVVGLVETHARQETQALLHGLDRLPLRALPYRGQTLQEFDLDAALRRRPDVLLVDELAHTNVPGSRHPKRWHDVVELLDSGIEVWTTLNVQHLESLNDVVAQVTGVRVRETLPDAALERADEVELVDLPPDALLQRLKDGKVYAPEAANRATGGFFKRGNLLALRELALRRTAERVDEDVRAHRHAEGIEATWPVAEHILVCVGPTPSSADLVRAAKRMAAGLRARWTALAVEVPQNRPAPQAQAALVQHMRLAEQLGAQVVTLTGNSVSEEVLAWARAQNVTRIVLGKPTHPRWRDVLFGSLLDEVVRGSGDIQIHAIAGLPAPMPDAPQRARRPLPSLRELTAASLAIASCTGIAALLYGHVATSELAMVYLLGIVAVATRFGRAASLLASILSVAAFDFCFVPPHFTFAVSDVNYVATFSVMFVVGVVISTLTERVRHQGMAARRREARTAALYGLSRELARARDLPQILMASRTHIASVFDAQLLFLVTEPTTGMLEQPAPRDDFQLDQRDASVAAWVLEHDQLAGLTTDTLAAAHALFLPLATPNAKLGVLGVLPADPARLREPGQRQLLETFAQQVVGAMARVRLTDDAHSSRVQAERQELRNSLLSTVSHDLRTPLAAITGSATTLLEHSHHDAETRRDLLETIRDEADRLNRLVTNLLDMTRLESGGLQPKREWTPLEEIVGASLDHLSRALVNHTIRVDLPANLPLLPVDVVLFEQVLMNLLDNAAKYTPPGTPIEISAQGDAQQVVVEVADRGPGLPAGSEARIFDRFFRAPSGSGIRGTGLGLAIVHGIVTAHGGTVSARNREGGGAVFRLTLPVEGAPSAPPEEEA